MRKTALQRELERFDLDLDLYRRAQQFFRARRFTLGYGGRGKYAGRFHLSGLFGGGDWRAFVTADPTDITDRPGAAMADLQALGEYDSTNAKD